jgi:hypothetical protein
MARIQASDMLKFGKEEQRSKKALTRFATLVLSKCPVAHKLARDV